MITHLLHPKRFWWVYNIRIFSDTVLHRYEDSLENVFKQALAEDVYSRSIAFGDTIGKTILARAKKICIRKPAVCQNILAAMQMANGSQHPRLF